MKWYAHKSRICRDISIFVGCTKNLNQCNADADADAGVTVIALHILRIVELKIPHFGNVMSIINQKEVLL